MTIRIVLADDHALVRQGIRAFLETEPGFVVVGEAANSEEAAALCAVERPDVAVIDMVMPGGGGVAATRTIRAVSPNTAIVILSSFEDDDRVLEVVRAGALSYLLKDASAEELVVALHCAARNESVLHPRIAARVVRALRDATADPGLSLSDREREVLLLIGEGLGNLQIATRLGIGEKTVKTHVGNILSKLGLDGRTQVAVYAWRRGLIASD